MQHTKSNYEDIPVKVYCPLSEKEEIVFFRAPIVGEVRKVSPERFSGCETNFHGCDECDCCRFEAFEILKKLKK